MKKPVSKLNHGKINCVNMVHTFNKYMQGCKSTKTTYYIEPQSYTLSISEHALIYLLSRMTKLGRTHPLKEEYYPVNTMYFSAQLSSVPFINNTSILPFSYN